jgi:hypothetical protein
MRGIRPNVRSGFIDQPSPPSAYPSRASEGGSSFRLSCRDLRKLLDKGSDARRLEGNADFARAAVKLDLSDQRGSLWLVREVLAPPVFVD